MVPPSANIVQREFDHLSSNYEHNRLADWYRAHSEIILSRCPESLAGDVLDIGCGSGYFLRRLKLRCPGVNALGIDISAGMVKVAKEKSELAGLGDILFLQDDWENLSTSTRTIVNKYNFRLVVCANAFHYFLKPEHSLRQINRVLEPDGTFLLLERDKSRSLLTLAWALAHRYFIRDQVEFYQGKALAHLLSSAGFDRVAVAARVNKYFWKRKIYTSIALIEGRKPR